MKRALIAIRRINEKDQGLRKGIDSPQAIPFILDASLDAPQDN